MGLERLHHVGDAQVTLEELTVNSRGSATNNQIWTLLVPKLPNHSLQIAMMKGTGNNRKIAVWSRKRIASKLCRQVTEGMAFLCYIRERRKNTESRHHRVSGKAAKMGRNGCLGKRIIQRPRGKVKESHYSMLERRRLTTI
jgi:hypothetical protein